MSAHTINSAPFGAIMTPCGANDVDITRRAQQMHELLDSFHKIGIDAKFMVVPSSPVIYPEDLPDWLQKRCESRPQPTEAMLQAEPLKGDAKSIYFPKQEMTDLKTNAEVFPRTWFHWAGTAPKHVAATSMHYFWNLSPDMGHALIEETHGQSSDLSRLFPGITLSSPVIGVNHDASHISECYGPTCVDNPHNLFGTAYQIWRTTNPAAPNKRLIIISDSYGEYIATWYARYFKDVQRILANSIDKQDKDEAETFRHYLIDQANGAQVLLIFYDGNVLGGDPRQLQKKIFYNGTL